MLPATLQFIIAMLASALTDRLTRKMHYMREEQRILIELLQQATGKKRFAFTDDHRRRLAIKGKELTAKERKACCHIVRPATYWHGIGNSLPANMTAHARATWGDRERLMKFAILSFP